MCGDNLGTPVRGLGDIRQTERMPPDVYIADRINHLQQWLLFFLATVSLVKSKYKVPNTIQPHPSYHSVALVVVC